MSGPIELFLEEVSRGIGEVDALTLQAALAEIRGHLEESATGYEELGEGRGEAERLAVLAFGSREEAKAAVEKPRSVIDHSVFPLKETISFAAALPLVVMLARFMTNGLSWLILAGYLSIGIGLAVRGYRRRRFEWAKIGASLAVGTVLSAALIAPFLRVGMGGGLETVPEFNSNWRTNVEYWDRDKAANLADFKLMRRVLLGAGEQAVAETKSEKGYLLPHDGSYSYNSVREHTQDLSAAVAAWNKEARKFDVEKRAYYAELADQGVRRQMEDASRLHFAQNLGEIAKDYGRSIGAMWGLMLLCQAVGVFMRLTSEAATRFVQRVGRLDRRKSG